MTSLTRPMYGSKTEPTPPKSCGCVLRVARQGFENKEISHPCMTGSCQIIWVNSLSRDFRKLSGILAQWSQVVTEAVTVFTSFLSVSFLFVTVSNKSVPMVDWGLTTHRGAVAEGRGTEEDSVGLKQRTAEQEWLQGQGSLSSSRAQGTGT